MPSRRSEVPRACEQGVARLLHDSDAALADGVAQRIARQIVANVVALGDAHVLVDDGALDARAFAHVHVVEKDRVANLGAFVARSIGPWLPVCGVADANLRLALPDLDAAALGARTRLLSVTGADEAGDTLERMVKAAGIQARLHRDPITHRFYRIVREFWIDRLIDKIVDGTEQQAGKHSIKELERLRDDCIISVIGAVTDAKARHGWKFED